MASFIFFDSTVHYLTIQNNAQASPMYYMQHIDIVLQMITSLTHKIQSAIHHCRRTRVISIHRNKSFSLPTMSERFVFYYNKTRE